nr:hypothetical protein [Tanacetum cinerariifolium]
AAPAAPGPLGRLPAGGGVGVLLPAAGAAGQAQSECASARRAPARPPAGGECPRRLGCRRRRWLAPGIGRLRGPGLVHRWPELESE